MKAMHRILIALVLAGGVSLSASGKAAEPWFSQAELDQMLAPVALYPDTVLSHVLIAATYPLEVIQAARWSRANPGLSGEAAVAAVEHMEWDPSVMALAAFPELLARMDEDIEWTHRLGDAFLVQEPEVIDTIQQLRERAYAAGHLKTNEQVRVVRETRYIHIEPARPRVVYVPYYDPFVVYGNWWWSHHPPVVWRYRPRHVASVNFYWGTGYHVAPAFYFSSFHWSRRQVVVVNHHHHHYHDRRPFRSGRAVAQYRDARHWQHNPQHRRGVSYHRGVSEQRFVQADASSNRSSPARNVRARSSQRDWAADRRSSLNLSERQAARSTAGRSSDVQRSQRQVAGRAPSPTARPDATQRQRSSAQGDRARSETLTQRRGSSERTAAPAARQAGPERSAQRLQDNLAGRSAATRQERPAASGRSTSNDRARSTLPRERAAPSRERSAAPAASRQTPAQSRPSLNRAEPSRSTATREAPAQRSQPSAPARAASRPQARSQSESSPASRTARTSSAPVRSAPAPRATPPQRSNAPRRSPPSSEPARPAARPQSRPQPAAAPAPRSAPAQRAPAQRSAPAQRAASPQRDSGASRARSRERQ